MTTAAPSPGTMTISRGCAARNFSSSASAWPVTAGVAASGAAACSAADAGAAAAVAEGVAEGVAADTVGAGDEAPQVTRDAAGQAGHGFLGGRSRRQEQAERGDVAADAQQAYGLEDDERGIREIEDAGEAERRGRE